MNMKVSLILLSAIFASTAAFTAKPTTRAKVASKTALSVAPWDAFFSRMAGPMKPFTQRKKTAIIAGATGYIGKSTVREAVRQGYKTYALVRDASKVTSEEGQASYGKFFQGAEILEADVCDPEALTQVMQQVKQENDNIEAIISCLASRSGIKKDAYAIDYQATLNCLEAGRAVGAGHFVLLSAFCVKNPWLQFQQAKLKFEAALQEQNDMTYTIVRPTAFFKSVSGQLEVVQSGGPYILFGNGEVTRCNPIAESELAQFMMESVTDKSRENKIINVGGPDDPITMRMQGRMLFEITGMEPKYVSAPIWIFDLAINTLQALADLTGSEKLENAAETGRIGKYYAVESMLTTKPEEKFGKLTLRQHYEKIAVEGQEYDPYITMIAQMRGYDVKKINEEKVQQQQSQATTKKEAVAMV
eukprot:scaffold2707_cov169-Amphora_coffeaeformis.AAC.11